MRTIVLIILSCLFAHDSFSQDTEESKGLEYYYKLMGGSMNNEVRGKNNIYIVDSLPYGCVVTNKMYPYRGVVSVINRDSVSILVEDKQVLNGIIKDELRRYVDVDKVDVKENMTLTLCGDLSGKIESVIFSYSSTVNFPITAVEKMEERIKKYCRLKFDKNNPALSRVAYVSCSYGFYWKEMFY